MRPVLEHVSNPLAVTLKRFNDYSNNDIERLGYTLGDASAMTEFYRKRWSDPEPAVQFETLSGLGTNRMTPRQIVRLMQELKRSTAKQRPSKMGDVLPAARLRPQHASQPTPGSRTSLPRGESGRQDRHPGSDRRRRRRPSRNDRRERRRRSLLRRGSEQRRAHVGRATRPGPLAARPRPGLGRDGVEVRRRTAVLG